MKFQAILATSLWLLPLVAAGGRVASPTPAPAPLTCADADCQTSCGAIAGCEWKSTGQRNKFACVEVVHSTTHVACGSRTQAVCEDDDLCLKVKGDCVEVNLGVAKDGEACQVQLTLDNDGTAIYQEITNKGCAEGFICGVDNSTLGTEGEIIDGTCTPTKCLGKKVPGNCNGDISSVDSKDQCEAKTQRVTICHRTCSRKNPWVRITIDEDAWSGQGCGHMLQHNVEDECKNKFPWTEWGVNRKDYLIKFHGTRNHTRTIEKFKNVAEEKAYWRKWEPACPYVRNGQCCDWDDDTNPCCGEPPSTVTPVITHKKYVGPPGSCSADGYTKLQDDTYTAKTGSSYAYCYKTSVPQDAPECLYAVNMKDPAPVGGTNQKTVNVTGDFELLCPGDTKYLEGPIVPVPANGEGPYDSTVTGIGAKSGNTVASKDPATVKEIPADVFPVVEIKKYAGPPGKCSAADIMNMFDDLYTLPTASSSWQYCYKISVPPTAKECLNAVTMVDSAVIGGTTRPIGVATGTAQLCAGAVTFINGGVINGLTAPAGPDAATVTGTGVISGSSVSASDVAMVSPPPVIEIKKYAGPQGKCSAGDMDSMLDDKYTLPTSASSWQYCYKITVPPTGPECLFAVTMIDTAPLGGTNGTIYVTVDAETFCPGDVKYIDGSPVPGLNSTEGPINATVTGTGVTTNVKVSDDDDATVSPPPVPVIPVIEIKKYAGPEGKCSAAGTAEMSDDLYTLPSAGSSWQYCYKITVPPSSTECLSGITMVDPALLGGSVKDITTGTGQLCQGAVQYVSGPVVVGLKATEGPVLATVTGTGVTSKANVSASDPASVSPPPNPLIEIKKYAGPPGKCSGGDIESKAMVDDTYTLPAASASWQYCYVITVPPASTECITGVKMIDTAGLGGITTGFDYLLCPSDVKYVDGPTVEGLTTAQVPVDAVVTGTGVTSKKEVTAKDSAAVKPPVTPDPLCVKDKPVTPKCPADVKLMNTPKTLYPFNPITIIKQDVKTVTFNITNPFMSDVHAMYYQYAAAETGTSRCDSDAPFTYCQDPITVTAHCMDGAVHPLAVVDVWFVDPKVVDSSSSDTVPECCHADAEDASIPKVVYSFKVYCQTVCPTTGRRDLAESIEQVDDLAEGVKHDGKAELCSLEQHGCGDDGKSVNVCHYSAKDGYQTYCVPQADSDVVAYFPKDYCGPCVGGYAKVDASS